MANTEDKRTADFHIRMSEGERANLDRIAATLCLTRSELVRYLAQLPASELTPGARRVIYLDKRALALIHREMRRYGTNFNQATRALNTVALRMRNVRLEPEEAQQALASIEARLDKANSQQLQVLEKMSALEGSMFVR